MRFRFDGDQNDQEPYQGSVLTEFFIIPHIAAACYFSFFRNNRRTSSSWTYVEVHFSRWCGKQQKYEWLAFYSIIYNKSVKVKLARANIEKIHDVLSMQALSMLKGQAIDITPKPTTFAQTIASAESKHR